VKRPLHLVVFVCVVAVLTQGFQCASPEMSTARNAFKQKDYQKARLALEKVVAAEPTNCEAWMLLGDANQNLNDTDGMVAAYAKARACPDVRPEQQSRMSLTLYNAWVGEYNGAIASFNKYVETKDRSELDVATTHLERALVFKPEFSEPLYLLGQVQETKGDTNRALSAYEKWWAMEEQGFNVLKQKGVLLGMSRGDVLKKLGTPAAMKTDTIENGVIFKDRFDIGGRDIYTFSTREGTAVDGTLEGFTYNPPSTLTDAEKWRSRTTSVSALKAMAYIAYQRGKLQEAYDYCTKVIELKPADAELVPLRTQLLQELGKTDEAMVQLKGLVEREPKNTVYRLQYASLLSGADRTDEAIAEYRKVLETDPGNEAALYNLAAAYKNLAGTKQKIENDKLDKDKKYKPNTAYLDDLRTSADYFERLRKSFKYRDDLIVLDQLANIYEVSKDKSKVAAIIMELEALEEKYRTSAEYYRVMEGLYARNKMMDKMKTAADKGARLK